jgi:hypothetical protein
MADTTIAGPLPALTEIEITTSPSIVTVPVGVASVALLETTTHLQLSQDGTTYTTPSSSAGLVLWSSSRKNGGTFYLKLSSGGPHTRQLDSRDHL